jgi:hypothetical protein
LGEFIQLQKSNATPADYNNCYNIIVSGITYGVINLHNYKAFNSVRIELSNQFLYTNSSFHIITNLFKISQKFHLEFCNVSKYELARDTIERIYDEYSCIYYQSTFCASQVHKVHNSKPIYSNYKKSSYNPIISDAENRNFGTAYIGSPKSTIQLKIYNKDRELKKWANRKNYISQIHQQHFGSNQIDRVEAKCDSKAINKYKWDMFDVLNQRKHPEIFHVLVGDKLTFKDLTTKYWVGGNDKYDLVKLMPNITGLTATKSIRTEPQQPFMHSQHINKLKLMIHSFLDNEIGVLAMHSFIKNNIWQIKKSDNPKYQLDNILRTYKNPKVGETANRIRYVKNLIDSNGGGVKLIRTYFNYIF